MLKSNDFPTVQLVDIMMLVKVCFPSVGFIRDQDSNQTIKQEQSDKQQNRNAHSFTWSYSKQESNITAWVFPPRSIHSSTLRLHPQSSLNLQENTELLTLKHRERSVLITLFSICYTVFHT